MIETGMQSAGLAILLLRYSLPSPESDLTLVVPVSVMMFTVWPLAAIGMPQLIVRCKSWRKKRNQLKSDSKIELQADSKNTKVDRVADEKSASKENGVFKDNGQPNRGFQAD